MTKRPISIVLPFAVKCLLAVLGGLLSGGRLTGQIAFEANFENGRLDTAYSAGNAFVVAPITNLHFRATGVLQQSPVFKIFDDQGYRLRPYHHMVYRYAGEKDWHFFDTSYKQQSVDFYHFYNFSPFTQDTIYVAYWFPYTYSDLQHFMDSIAGSPYLQNAGSKGISYQGRNLYGYEITDTNFAECYKSQVVITARQHPIENINGYFVEGLTRYLLYSEDTTAAFLRRNYHFYIYPMLNPDGVFNGSAQNALGQGLNREWEDSLWSGGTPEIDTIRPVIWRETGQKVDWSIDIHANPGSNIPYYWWGYTHTSGVPADQVSQAAAYVQAVAAADTSSPQATSSFQNYIQGNGVNNAKTAANWFRKTFQAVAFTFEPTSEPMGPTGNNAYTIAQLKTAGASLAKGFGAVMDTVPALGGTIHAGSSLLVAQVSGGHPPYSYNWSGPVSGMNDTLFHPQTGIYTLSVSDALGCVWTRQLNYLATGTFSEEDFSIMVYPNPARDAIYLICRPASPQSAKVIWYESGGRQIGQSTLSLAEKTALTIPAQGEGVYLLKIITEKGVYFHKILRRD